MRRIRPGRGGWAINGSAQRFIQWFAVLKVALALCACSSKKPDQGAEGASTTQMGESTFPGKGGSSLEQWQKGRLGAGGPLNDIHFDYDDYTVRPQDSEILHFNARWLSEHGRTRVQVEGHCDSRGSEEYNLALGARRAQAAKDYLTTLGISGTRISTISYGKELPLCTEENEECWAQNRRDHFVVNQ